MTGAALARIVLVLLALCGGATAVPAHETTRSYATLVREGHLVDARLRVAFRDIEVATWLDEDLDGTITWGETKRRLDAIDAYVRSGFTLSAGGACEMRPAGAQPTTSGGVAYLDLRYSAECPDAEAPLTVRSTLLNDIDPDHSMFLQASIGGAVTSAALRPLAPSIDLVGDTGRGAGSFLSYFRAGMQHLIGGADHVVFLLALMLPAVCARGSARKAGLAVVAAATGFTLAHALSLTAATTELLAPPAELIGVLIVLSILVTAVDNVRPFIPAPRAAVAAFFGIIHGFGFAGALGPLQLTAGSLALALLGFNVGIEAAQIAIVLLVMPALYMLAGGRALLWTGSLAIAAVSLWWLWGQALDPVPTAAF